MTLIEIRAMLTKGSRWRADRDPPWPAGGDSAHLNGAVRTVHLVTSRTVIYLNQAGGKFYGDLPKKADVIEARDGLLKFRLAAAPQITVTMLRVPDGAETVLTDLEWEDAVLCAIEEIGEATRSDAQGLFEGQSDLADRLMAQRAAPADAARAILDAATPDALDD